MFRQGDEVRFIEPVGFCAYTEPTFHIGLAIIKGQTGPMVGETGVVSGYVPNKNVKSGGPREYVIVKMNNATPTNGDDEGWRFTESWLEHVPDVPSATKAGDLH